MNGSPYSTETTETTVPQTSTSQDQLEANEHHEQEKSAASEQQQNQQGDQDGPTVSLRVC